MHNWKKHKLKDLVSFKTGKLDSNAAVDGGQYPFFTCAPETLAINDYVFDTTAILLAGNNATGVFPIKFYSGKFNCYQRTYVIENVNAIECDLKFIYFALQMQLSFLQSLSIGAATKFLTKRLLDNLKLPLPDLQTQHKIAAILSSYDDLIENNLKRIKLLEETPQITYEEWFVRLKFPGHETASMDSETGLPVGWGKRNLQEFCGEITDGTHESPKEVEDGFKLVTGKHILNGFIDFETAYSISEKDHLNIRKRSGLNKGDILFSNIGTLGNIAVVTQDFEFSCKNVVIFKYKNGYSNFLYTYLANENTKNKLSGQSAGVAQKFYSLKFIRNFDDFFPPNELIEEFDGMVKSYYELKYNLHSQNQLLKEARDILLPRLMTGMIDVEQLVLPEPFSNTASSPEQESQVA
ncbi:MAG: restriction endonuclease subunit S [Methylobacter sp.]|nr:restriction endonuclease subunit S [Methylobacter sp.]